MKETQYIVAQTRGEWTIHCGGRVFDRFEDKDDAILTALIQAQNARRQGRVSRVLLEELGHARPLWDEGLDASLPGGGKQAH